MPLKCKAPKCAIVSNTCACPNAWLEFLAKNSIEHKMSVADHAKAYRKLKDSGAFKPKPGSDNGPCKTDTVKLCKWKLNRTMKGPSVPEKKGPVPKKNVVTVPKKTVEDKASKKVPVLKAIKERKIVKGIDNQVLKDHKVLQHLKHVRKFRLI